MKITHSQLVNLISTRKGAVAIGIEAVTDARARKTGNPHGAIFKVSRSSALCGVNYEAAINRRLDGQGDAPAFKAESLWNGKGEYVVPGKIARHKETGRLYLAIQASDKQFQAFPAKVSYQDGEGKPLAYDEVKPFLPESSFSVKQAAAGLSENQQNVRLYALDSLTAIHLDGETLEVVTDEKDLLDELYAAREERLDSGMPQ
jgi:hypothetical protein